VAPATGFHLFSGAALPDRTALASSPLSLTHRLSNALAVHRRWVVLAMLLALHAALVSEPGQIFQGIWLLVHFGFFLLWQPFFATEQEIDMLSASFLFAIIAGMVYFLSGWMIVGWLLLLLGILGGRVFTVQAARRNRFYLVAFFYVIAILLLWAVPSLLLGSGQIPYQAATFARVALPAGLLLLVVMPLGPPEPESGQVFDFFYAVLVFQLGLVLVLGSVALMRFTEGNYFASVALTVLGFGVGLFIFAVMWNPMRGFGGLRTYFSRYLLSVGMPFELWMRRIAELAETESDSTRFLEESLKEIASLPWMRGGHWRSPVGEGSFGAASGHATRFTYHALEVVFYTETELSPALFLHMRLLAQVVGEFHEGKRRETALRHNAYLQAVHETGARLTHDVKNLLQSLYALTSMAPRDSSDAYAGLLQRQLPELTRRLHTTIEKLRTPAVPTVEMAVDARGWWTELERRLGGGDIDMTAAIEVAARVPKGLFDSFVENALENARAKAAGDATLAISIRFVYDARQVELSVCDNGAAVPDAVARRLFREPIERGHALGIGLFHAARLAREAGFALELGANRDGEVCFVLRRDGAPDLTGGQA
jgi:hypothetical protein